MASSYDSDLAKKLNVKSGMRIRVLHQPPDLDLTALPVGDSSEAEAVLAFVRTLAEVEGRSEPVVQAARAGQVAWMAYPKARQLGTDLNRDVLWRALQARGVEANRQISIDDTWSAIRFRSGD